MSNKWCFVLLTFALVLNFIVCDVEPWFLPVFPPKMALPKRPTDSEKLIPRILWMAVKEIEEHMNYQLPALFERNKNWKVNIVDNHNKDVFMNTVSNFFNMVICRAFLIIYQHE